jgi:hypothetical protein
VIAKKGDWVNVHDIVLTSEQRAPQVPEDTKSVPLELWVKGIAQSSANLGDLVEIETLTGRKVTGKLVDVFPTYTHSFGDYVPELHTISTQLRSILFGGDQNE